MSQRRALVVGLGLIGGSIGKALRARGWAVAFADPNVDDPDDAADRRGPLDDDADVTILATPEDVAVTQLPPVTRGVVTSVCSVMAPFHAIVAGHPMAGSEQTGLAAARADLFAGKRWFLARDEPIVRQVAEDCGATVEIVDALEHDAAVALTSHLPQILSTALAAYLQDQRELLRFAGTGLATFLRLAGSDASVWTPIVRANRGNIEPHAKAVAELVQRIMEGDEEAFDRAQRLYAALTYHPRP
jgi:prephenate dehydrogenase